jgi:hypothetical protein
MASIQYRELKGYKYLLMEPYAHETGLTLVHAIKTRGQWVSMTKNGLIKIKKGYAWDGPSGPTIDTKDFLRGSLVHDALYQLIREKLLPGRTRKKADRLLFDICREDGMNQARADYVYHAVRAFGGRAVRPQPSEPIVIEAP